MTKLYPFLHIDVFIILSLSLPFSSQQPSQQQKQRAAQSTEGVLKAYGVPKSSLSGAGGGYNNGMLEGGGGSKILDGGGSKYSIGAGAGAGAGTGAGAYGAYPVSQSCID